MPLGCDAHTSTTAPVKGSGLKKRAAPGQSGLKPPVGEGATKRDGRRPAAQSRVVGGGHSCPVVGAGVWAFTISGSRSHGRGLMVHHCVGCPGERYRRLLDLHRLPLGPSLVSPRAVWRGAREASERVRCFRICRDVGFWNNSRESNLRVQWPLLCFCAGSHSARRASLTQRQFVMPQRSQNSLLVEQTRSRRPHRSLQTHKSAGALSA